MNRNEEEERIFEALSTIETPACDLESAVFAQLSAQPAHKRRWTAQRLTIAVLAAILALTLTAAAVIGLSESWEQFFGEEVKVPENIVLKLNESKTVGDYTFMIDNALVSEDSALVMLTLSRADGQPIDPGIGSFGEGASIWVDGEHYFSNTGDRSPYMSPGNTAKHWSLYASNGPDGGNLLNKTLSIKINKIVQPSLFTGDISGDMEALSTAAKSAPVSFTHEPNLGSLRFSEEDEKALRASIETQKSAAKFSMPLADEFSGARFVGAVTVDGRLALVLEQDQQNGERSLKNPMVWRKGTTLFVTDVRSGIRYEGYPTGSSIGCIPDDIESSRYGIVELAPVDAFPEFVDFTLDDLPYLKPEVQYNLFTSLISEPIMLSFAAQSRPSVSVPLSGSVEIAGIKSSFKRAVISPLSIDLYLGGMDETTLWDMDWQDIPITLELLYKDGTHATGDLRSLGDGQLEGETASLTYEMQTEDGSRVFPDTEQIQSIIINGTEYPIP